MVSGQRCKTKLDWRIGGQSWRVGAKDGCSLKISGNVGQELFEREERGICESGKLGDQPSHSKGYGRQKFKITVKH